MASISLFGGVSEIGGNKIVTDDGETRLILDFGMSITGRSRYFSDPYVTPRTRESLLQLGIIPDIGGLYSWEKSGGDGGVDAIFLTHAHLDHYGYLSMINRDIPVYCGETTRTMMEAIAETRRASFESDYKGIRYSTFRTGDRVKVGSVTVKPVHVDHSIPGAYGLVVETSSGRMVYTGDLRSHGTASRLTADFVDEASAESPDLLLTEATNMVGGVVSSEAEVAKKLQSVIGRAKALVMASFSTMDTDRLQSFYSACRDSDRTLVLSMKQAYFLSRLNDDRGLKLPSLRDGSLAIYRRGKKRFEGWEEEVCGKGEVVTASEIGKEQKRFVFAASLSDMEALIGVKPEEGSVYVLSSSEPFNEEMELDMQRLIQWLDFYGMPLYHIHVSGHIMPQDLRELVSRVDAARIVPIHTEHPELFSRFIGGRSERIVVPRLGSPIGL